MDLDPLQKGITKITLLISHAREALFIAYFASGAVDIPDTIVTKPIVTV